MSENLIDVYLGFPQGGYTKNRVYVSNGTSTNQSLCFETLGRAEKEWKIAVVLDVAQTKKLLALLPGIILLMKNEK